MVQSPNNILVWIDITAYADKIFVHFAGFLEFYSCSTTILELYPSHSKSKKSVTIQVG